MYSMKRIIAFVSGKVRRVGYGLGYPVSQWLGSKRHNRELERWKSSNHCQGDEEKMKLFEEAIDIKNTFIQVTTIEKIYSQ